MAPINPLERGVGERTPPGRKTRNHLHDLLGHLQRLHHLWAVPQRIFDEHHWPCEQRLKERVSPGDGRDDGRGHGRSGGQEPTPDQLYLLLAFYLCVVSSALSATLTGWVLVKISQVFVKTVTMSADLNKRRS